MGYVLFLFHFTLFFHEILFRVCLCIFIYLSHTVEKFFSTFLLFVSFLVSTADPTSICRISLRKIYTKKLQTSCSKNSNFWVYTIWTKYPKIYKLVNCTCNQVKTWHWCSCLFFQKENKWPKNWSRVWTLSSVFTNNLLGQFIFFIIFFC